MTTIAWFHCFSGIAGDMALGALVDAGADPAEVRAMCEQVPVDGWELRFEPVMRCGIAGTSASVITEETHVHRTAAHIIGLVEEARLPDRVTRRALATFEALAVAEGRLHGKAPSEVHFHEVGGIDAIIDVVGTCAALELLGVDELYASPVANGIGIIKSAHGLIPNPAPAVVALLEGAPTYGIDVPLELTTPTGAALLAANASSFGPIPAMTIDVSGFGAGDRELEGRPNMTQVVVGTTSTAREHGQPVVLVEVNVDDATGELLADAVVDLLAAGAHDAWITPILMKKGRPAYTVSALCDPVIVGQVVDEMVRGTGSLGVRTQTFERWPQARDNDTVEVDGRLVRVKVSAGRVKVEHDDARRAAVQLGRPIREVISLAEEAARRRTEHDHPPEPPEAG